MTRLSWLLLLFREKKFPNRFASLRAALVFELFYLCWLSAFRGCERHYLRAFDD